MQTPEVLKKVGRFADLVDIYRERYDVGEDDETTLTDLMADLMHWCDSRGLEFALVENRAEIHYAAEVRGEE